MLFTLSLTSLALLSALVAPAVAQTSTNCNPLNSTCPSDPALGTKYNQTFTSSSSLDSNIWNTTAGQVGFNDDGATFQIVKSGDSVTTTSSFYIFWGKVEVIMRAASGQGIISSLVMLSDDLDEIDWEVMGGNTSFVETNYYGKGDQTQRNALYYPCDNPQGGFHNYTTVWTQEQLEWHLDGNIVRTLPYAQAVGAGKDYPQTPSFFRMGIWAGGDPKEPKGTIEWAGGPTDYSKGPYTMTVRSLTITDFTTNATSYAYGDKTGAFESIKIDKSGPSPQAAIVNAPPPLSVSERFNALPEAAKISIIAVPSAIGLALLALALVCCCKQRALGRRERAIEDAQYEKNTADMMAFRKRYNTASIFQPNHGAYQSLDNRKF